MATMNLSLPDDLKAFVEAEAARQGFGTVDDYLRAVIQADRDQKSRRGRVDALLLEGLDSGPATPLVAADWEALDRQLEEREAARQGASHAAKRPGGR